MNTELFRKYIDIINENTDPRDAWMDPVNRKNAEFAQTHYAQPADDSVYNDGTYGDSMAYQNYKSRKNTAQQNRVNSASQDAAYKAKLAAHSQHTSPIYSSQEEWNTWVRQGGLDYARDMDLQKLSKDKKANYDVSSAEQQAYIRQQNQIAQNRTR